MTGQYKLQNLHHAARDFVHHELLQGRSLARALLSVFNHEWGRVVAFLPPDANPDTVVCYRCSGILRRAESLAHVASLMSSFLATERRSVCVFEDYLRSPADPWFSRRKTRAFTFGREVYHWLESPYDSHPEKVIETITEAEPPGHFVGTLSSLDETAASLVDGQEVGQEVLTMLAKRSRAILVAAFDGEGYVIWYREEGHARSPLSHGQAQPAREI